MAEPSKLARLKSLRNSPEVIAAKTRQIYDRTLGVAPHFGSANFEAIAIEDLAFLFERYDAEFFGGLLESMLREVRAYPIRFRLSSRMTNAGGRTMFRKARVPGGIPDFEIAISTVLLFQTFGDIDRPVLVTGLICKDRLEALQRIFEHELLHLAEFLATETSNCKAPQFKAMAGSIFGHRASVHELVTPRELAAATHAIRVGDMVSFDFDGVTRVGRVNRITRRASVLVDDPTGPLFSNGGRYQTFYIPLSMLRKQG